MKTVYFIKYKGKYLTGIGNTDIEVTSKIRFGNFSFENKSKAYNMVKAISRVDNISEFKVIKVKLTKKVYDILLKKLCLEMLED